MKKLAVVFIILAVIAAAWAVLLRPSDISQDKLTESYLRNKDAFRTAADYLKNNGITAEISGPVTDKNSYGVPASGDDFGSFAEASETLMKASVSKIISDGETVEFVYKDNGGLLNRLEASVIYSGSAPDRIAVSLGEECWYLYIGIPAAEE